MPKQEIDIKRFSVDDWEKYNHMRHISQGGNWRYVPQVIFLVVFAALILSIFYMILATPSPKPYDTAQNYTSSLWTAQVKSLNLTSLNITHNATMTAYITALSGKREALATLAVYEYATLNAAAQTLESVAPLVILVIFVLLMFWLGSDTVPRSPSSKKAIEERNKKHVKADAKLRAQNYTEADIVWFHMTARAIRVAAYLGD